MVGMAHLRLVVCGGHRDKRKQDERDVGESRDDGGSCGSEVLPVEACMLSNSCMVLWMDSIVGKACIILVCVSFSSLYSLIPGAS